MKSDLPIACTLSPEELRRGRDALLPGIIARAQWREPVDGGFRFRYKSELGLLPALAAMIESERRCCRFLTLQVIAEPDEGPVWLEVTGPPGTAEFLESQLQESKKVLDGLEAAVSEYKLKHNGEHDCHDDTVGPYAGLTANFWRNNEGDTENRPD